MAYRWKSGARVPVNAQVAGEVCERLESQGKLTPSALVEESRPDDAPLHKAFEWNDAKAAELYRETQARYIIRSLELVREDKEPTRAFVTLERTAKTHEYHGIDTVLASHKDTEELLKQAKFELAAFKRKYSQLTQLVNVFNAIDALEVA